MGTFHFVKGNNFLHPEGMKGKIQEGFIYNEDSIDAQVSAEHIKEVMIKFLTVTEEANFFLFIEAPVNLDEEEIAKPATETTPGILTSSRRKVYYLDDLSINTCLELLEIFGEILINDGISAFGFGSVHSEIGKYKYNQLVLFLHNPELDYRNVFLQAGIPENNDLAFVSEYITEKNPGVSERYEDAQGRSIYDIIDTLKEVGLYEAEVRGENPVV